VLSEALEAPLVTIDARLGRAPAHGARITVVDSDAVAKYG
jgi:hypothetical protein